MATSVTAPTSASSREARLTAAEAASEAKEWRRAAELWDELRGEFPENVRYWNKAGEAYCHAGVFERADLVLTEAIALFPENEWAAYWSIIVARRQGGWPEALRRAERMGRSFPASWRPMVEAADALAALQRPIEAEEIRREALKRFPDEFWTNFGVARLEAERSDPPGAMRIWSELVARFPDQPEAVAALQAARDATRHPLRQRTPTLPGDEIRKPEAPTRPARGFPWRLRTRAKR
jgi:predicted Zn-dependent protease